MTHLRRSAGANGAVPLRAALAALGWREVSVGHGGCREGSSQRSAVGSLAGDPSWPHLMKGGNAGAASCRFGEPSVAGAGGGWSLVDVPLSAASM